MFEFYFGEIIETNSDAWLTILGSALGALLGFSGAYFIFRFQRSADIMREKNRREYEEDQMQLEESKRCKEIINYLRTSIRSIINPGLQQAQSIDELVIILKTEEVLDLKLTSITSFRVDWFDGIDKVELFNSFKYHFENNEKNSNYFYNQVVGRISLIRDIVHDLEKRFFEVRDLSNRYEDRFNEGKASIVDFTDPIVRKGMDNTHYEYQNVEKEIFETLYKNWFTVENEKRREIFYSFKNLIQPLVPIVEEYGHGELSNLKPVLRQCHSAFKNLDKTHKFYANWFDNYSSSIKCSLQRLQIILERLKEKND